MSQTSLPQNKLEAGQWLINLFPREPGFWPWIEDIANLDKRRANKFLLGCLLDIQIKAEQAWENARRLSEDELGDPDGLWQVIADLPEQEWLARRPLYRLHRFHWVHLQVRQTAIRMVADYDGDARTVWKDTSASKIVTRLWEIGLGEQRSRMAVGALIDTGHLTGKGDVKADIHVRRVLGRVFRGANLNEEEATRLARQLSPENPWLVDRPAYLIGKEFCKSRDPRCHQCRAKARCLYFGGG